jgi:hypothetical protein
MKKTFIEKFDAQGKAVVLDYAANHSSRETAAFIQKQFGVSVSYVTITAMQKRHYAQLPTEVKIIKYQSSKNIFAIQTYLMEVFEGYKAKVKDLTLSDVIRAQYQAGAVELGLKIAKIAAEVIKTPLAATSSSESSSVQEVDTMRWAKTLDSTPDEVVEGEGVEKTEGVAKEEP